MKKIVSQEIYNELLTGLGKNFIHFHTCQILEKGTTHKWKPLGTGVLIKYDQKRYIFTASHVTEGIGEDKSLFINTISGVQPITGFITETDLKKNAKVDLAFIELNEELAEVISKTYDFLDQNKIDVNHISESNVTQYMVFGYPEKNIIIEKNIVRTGSEFFMHSLAKQKVYEYYKFDPSSHIIVLHSGKGLNMQTNTEKKVNIEPYGMSGCGVWYIKFIGDENNPQIDYSLVGIMTEFKKGKYHILIGCKIHLIIQKLDESI